MRGAGLTVKLLAHWLTTCQSQVVIQGSYFFYYPSAIIMYYHHSAGRESDVDTQLCEHENETM